MAEKAEKKAPAPAAEKKDAGKGAAPAPAAAPEAAAEKKKGGGFLTKTPVLLGGVMIIEAIVLFAGIKFLGSGAKNANGADLTIASKKDAKDAKEGAGGEAGKDGAVSPDANVEVQLLESRFPNKQSGRTFLYDVAMSVSVKSDKQDEVKKMIADHDALIIDRVRTIIAELDPDKLGGGSEPGLETLRRQVKYQLDEVLGDGMVEEVLVTRCIPFRTDY
jgi:flagellar basal body-associated protein FliL